MARAESKVTRSKSITTVRGSRRGHLEELIANAIIDCYNESEEATGLYTRIEENLSLPFTAKVLGVVVIVEKVDIDN